MFDLFYTTKSTGTGIGLATVKRLIERQRGTIGVASTPGQGTVFTVRLPLDGGLPAPARASRPDATPARDQAQRAQLVTLAAAPAVHAIAAAKRASPATTRASTTSSLAAQLRNRGRGRAGAAGRGSGWRHRAASPARRCGRRR